MSKVGILGGTFNPIHNGHLYLADIAYKQLNLDKVLIMPTGVSYLKASQDVLPSELRSEMVKLAIKDYSYFEFSDIEIKREGNTYTCDTLNELNTKYPNNTYYFITGADTLFNIEYWKNPDQILKSCILSVIARDNMDINDMRLKANELTERFGAVIKIIDCEKMDISSTLIRNYAANAQYDDIANMLPNEVLKYIIDNSLYKR